MAEGADRQAWKHTASVMATIAVQYTEKGQPPKPPTHFDPYEKSDGGSGKGITLTADNITMLRP